MIPGGSAKKVRRERTIQCSFCELSFNKKEHAVRHERTHTLDRPYVCDFPECGKTFARRDTLTRHTRLHKRDESSPAPGGESAHPSSSSSLSVPKPARKRRARNGSANSTLVQGDSTDDPASSSAENDMVDDEELGHKAAGGNTAAEKVESDIENDDEVDSKPFISSAPVSRSSSFASYDFNNVSKALPVHSASLAAAAAAAAPFVAPLNMPSALGLDIGLPPQTTFTAPALPAFVQATREDFRSFRPSFSTSSSDTTVTPSAAATAASAAISASAPRAGISAQLQLHFQQQHQSAFQHNPATAAAAAAAATAASFGQQLGSFLACNPGRADFAQLSQLDPLAVAAAQANANQQQQMQMHQKQQQMRHQRQVSQDYAPFDDLASSYSTSPSWAGSDLSLGFSDSPTSESSSLPSLSSSMPHQQPQHSQDDYAYYYGDTDISAFKTKEAAYQPMTMSIGLPTRKASVDYDSKHHLYMLMRAAETTTDEFLRWPSRSSSPALGLSFSSSHERYNSTDSSKTSSSITSDSSGRSSFLDFNEYDSTRCALFGDKMLAAPGPPSPIASLEEWLVRQSGEPSEMVF